MKIFRLFAALAFLSSAIACGGSAVDEENLDDVKFSASEPTTWVSMAQKAAVSYAHDSSLMHIDGSIGPTDGFIWKFTFADWSAGNWVTVACDGKSAHVVEHHHVTAEPMGSAVIQMSKVKVNFTKLMKIAGANGLSGRLLSVDLSEALTVDMHPHWYVNQGGHELAIDANTGALFK